MTTVKLSSKNQVVIPKETRDHLGVGPGDELLVVPKGDRVILLAKPTDVVDALAGSAPGIYGGAKRHHKRERASWTRKASRKL